MQSRRSAPARSVCSAGREAWTYGGDLGITPSMRPFHWLAPPLLCAFIALTPAAELRGAQSAQDHTYTSQDIEAGSRLYAGQCALCHGPNGDACPGRQPPARTVPPADVRRGSAPRHHDRRCRSTAMPPVHASSPPSSTASWRSSARASTSAARRSRSATPARGQPLFEGKGACATCHRVNGKGPRVGAGPERHRRDPIADASSQRSLIEPTEPMCRSIGRCESSRGTAGRSAAAGSTKTRTPCSSSTSRSGSSRSSRPTCASTSWARPRRCRRSAQDAHERRDRGCRRVSSFAQRRHEERLARFTRARDRAVAIGSLRRRARGRFTCRRRWSVRPYPRAPRRSRRTG